MGPGVETNVPAERRRAQALAVALARKSYDTWATRYYKIRTKRNRIISLVLRKGQRRVGDAETYQLKTFGRARIYVLKGRQGGITTDQQARSLHACWAGDGVQCVTAADTGDRADEIFGITRRALTHFPRELLPGRGPARAREVHFTNQDSRYRVITAGVPEKTAIGLTLTRFHGSEFAHWPEPKPALAALEPALEAPGTTIVLETTASGFDSEGYQWWHECEAAGWARVFVPWWECDPEEYQLPLMEPDELGALDDDEAALVAVHGLSLEQIKWRRAKIRSLGRNEFLRQYAEDDESCWLSAGGMRYEAELLRVLIQRAQGTTFTEELGGDRRIYGKRRPGERVIIGADTAEGVNQDSSTYTVRAWEGWRLLETYNSATIQPTEFAQLLNQRGRFYGDAFLVVEKNLHGISVLRDLRDKLEYPVSEIYHRETLDGNAAEAKERIGWHTSGESKTLLLTAAHELFLAVKDGYAGLPSEQTLKDALSVRRDKKGLYDLNGRDDLVAEMLAWIGRSAPMPSEGMFQAMQQRMAAKAAAAAAK